SGSGLGTTGLYILPTSELGDKRDSDGGYAQLTYKFDKVKLGASYGESRLKLASDEKALGADNSNLVKSNKSGVFGVYYSLTKSITLVGEYSNTKSKAFDGNNATEDTYILGGIIFF
ncbi:MAG TPA: porin, partial [Rudaea sp.]|nr:porin [Rudaea sp.]